VLFALSALSNSRETQHFNKLTRLPRIEHSPPLKLIKTGEVDPFPLPTPPKPAVSSGWPVRIRSPAKIWDEKALRVGRVFLTDQARRTHRLQRSLARAKRREVKKNALVVRERRAWHEERKKLRDDMRAAGAWILVSIGTATALAMWRFWPSRDAPTDSGQLGRKLAARAASAMPLPAVASQEPVAAIPPAAATNAAGETSQSVAMADKLVNQVQSSWWRGLFWKQ
jgi:hypothetical protein